MPTPIGKALIALTLLLALITVLGAIYRKGEVSGKNEVTVEIQQRVIDAGSVRNEVDKNVSSGGAGAARDKLHRWSTDR